MPEDEVHTRQNSVLQTLSVALIASPVFALAWAWGGMRGEVLRPLSPLLVLASVAGMLFLPQRQPGETAGMAWRRVWGRILRDPFTWTALALIVYLVIPLFNVGLSPILDAAAIAAGADVHPPFPYLPFCVSAREHLGVVCWFVPILLSSLGIRHALTRTGKRWLFEAIVWNGALLAALGFVQICTNAHFPFWGEAPHRIHFFSVFAYPNMAGAYFTLVYAFSLGLWVYRIEEVENAPLAAELGGAPIIHTRLWAHYPFVAVALLLCAVLATLCRAAMTLTFLLTGLFLVYVLLRPLAEKGMERARRFRSIIAVGGLFLALTGGGLRLCAVGRRAGAQDAERLLRLRPGDGKGAVPHAHRDGDHAGSSPLRRGWVGVSAFLPGLPHAGEGREVPPDRRRRECPQRLSSVSGRTRRRGIHPDGALPLSPRQSHAGRLASVGPERDRAGEVRHGRILSGGLLRGVARALDISRDNRGSDPRLWRLPAACGVGSFPAVRLAGDCAGISAASGRGLTQVL